MDNTILYNEETTAENLNNIAVDLGNTDFSVFSDGETYAVTKLNEITSSIVSKGILLSGGRCKPSLLNGILEIADGIIIFESGQKIKIEESMQFSISESGIYFVYAVNSLTTNSAQIEVLTEEKITSDFIPLCIITDGILTDARLYSKAFVSLPACGASYMQHIEGDIADGASVEKSINISGISKVFIISPKTGGFFDVKTGLYHGLAVLDSKGNYVDCQGERTVFLDYTGSGEGLKISVNIIEDTLTFYISSTSYFAASSFSFDVYAYGGEE